MVYDKSHKHCEECGVSFYSPWETNCQSCNTELLNLANEVDAEDRLEILQGVSEPWEDWITMRDEAITRTKTDGLFGRFTSHDTRG